MHISLNYFEKNTLRFFLLSLLAFVLLIVFYLSIGEDIAPESYLAWLLPVVFSLFLLQKGNQRAFLSVDHLPHAIAGLSWCITFSLLYALSYNHAWFTNHIRADLFFGVGLFVLFSALQTICLQNNRHPRFFCFLFAAADLVCLAIPLVEIAYYSIYQHCLTPATLMALYLTNSRESLDFIETTLGYQKLLLLLAALCLFWGAAFFCGQKKISIVKKNPLSSRQKKTLLFLSAGLCLYLPLQIFPDTSIITNWREVTDYVQETQQYAVTYDDRFSKLALQTKQTLAQKAPGTVIMIIGESATRNYMKAYTPSVPYDNTPWLQQRMQDPDFVVFQNVYSCWVQTVPVIERALTEESQYNDKHFLESSSILDVAKKAGYETYWFSNQGRYGQYDSAITMIAKTADHAEWTDDSYVFTEKYDEALLKFLPAVDPTKNNFIILHLMGSHIYYNNRYPEDFEKWQGEGEEAADAAYANSTLYTDDVLSKIYAYAKENLHLQAMVYCSDHGEDIHISHNPDVFKFDMVRIPMFVYLSDEYKAALPQQYKTLQKNRTQFFTNDMIYDTLSGILNAPSNHYDPGQDFSSPEYRFTKDNLTTMLGQKKLTEDPYLSPPTPQFANKS